MSSVLVRFDAEIRLNAEDIATAGEDVPDGILGYRLVQQAVQNVVGHTGVTVIDVTEYEEQA